jgi:cytochrome P450
VLVDNYKNYSKDTWSNQAFKKAIGPGLINFEGERWLNQRRLMQPAFHHSRLAAMDGLIVSAAQALLGRWQQSYAASQP